MMSKTPEQEARNILERMEIKGAQNFSAGELAEIANIIELHDFTRQLERERDEARAAMQHEREGYECAIAYGYAADAQRERAEKADAALADLKIKMTGNSRDYEVLLAERDAEIAGLREDAERYYFLRDDFGVSSLSIDGNHAWAYRNFSLRGPTLDAAIDAARKETK